MSVPRTVIKRSSITLVMSENHIWMSSSKCCSKSSCYNVGGPSNRYCNFQIEKLFLSCVKACFIWRSFNLSIICRSLITFYLIAGPLENLQGYAPRGKNLVFGRILTWTKCRVMLFNWLMAHNWQFVVFCSSPIKLNFRMRIRTLLIFFREISDYANIQVPHIELSCRWLDRIIIR